MASWVNPLLHVTKSHQEKGFLHAVELFSFKNKSASTIELPSPVVSTKTLTKQLGFISNNVSEGTTENLSYSSNVHDHVDHSEFDPGSNKSETYCERTNLTFASKPFNIIVNNTQDSSIQDIPSPFQKVSVTESYCGLSSCKKNALKKDIHSLLNLYPRGIPLDDLAMAYKKKFGISLDTIADNDTDVFELCTNIDGLRLYNISANNSSGISRKNRKMLMVTLDKGKIFLNVLQISKLQYIKTYFIRFYSI